MKTVDKLKAGFAVISLTAMFIVWYVIPFSNIYVCGKVVDRKTGEVVPNVTVVAVRKMFDQVRLSDLADEKGDYCFFLPNYLIEETWNMYYGPDNVYFNSTAIKGHLS